MLVGSVRSESSGHPIGGALVALDMGRRILAQADGTFRFEDVPPGPYRIAAVAPGCHVGLGTVEVAAAKLRDREIGPEIAAWVDDWAIVRQRAGR